MCIISSPSHSLHAERHINSSSFQLGLTLLYLTARMVPNFSALEPSEVLNPTLLSQLPRSKHKRVVDTVLHEVDELRNSCLQLFFSDTRHNTPSESIHQVAIREYESLYDQELRKFVEGIELHLMEDLVSRRSSKRGSNFDRVSADIPQAPAR